MKPLLPTLVYYFYCSNSSPISIFGDILIHAGRSGLVVILSFFPSSLPFFSLAPTTVFVGGAGSSLPLPHLLLSSNGHESKRHFLSSFCVFSLSPREGKGALLYVWGSGVAFSRDTQFLVMGRNGDVLVIWGFDVWLRTFFWDSLYISIER